MTKAYNSIYHLLGDPPVSGQRYTGPRDGGHLAFCLTNHLIMKYIGGGGGGDPLGDDQHNTGH